MRALLPIAIATLLVVSSENAEAQVQHGKPSHGYFAEMDLGVTGFLGETQRYAAPGPAFGIRAGRDIFRWFSLGLQLASSTHEATVPPPPEQEYFQLYHLGVDARLTVRFGRLAMFAEGGAGLAFISTNVLDRVAITDSEVFSPSFTAGGGLAWHTVNRHFSFGLAGDYTLLPDFDATQAVQVRLYLRYTK
jgi:hypothetical protein